MLRQMIISNHLNTVLCVCVCAMFRNMPEMKAEECSNNVDNYSATQYSIQLFQWRAEHHWQHDWTVTRTQYISRSVGRCVHGSRTYATITGELWRCFFTQHIRVCCLSTLQSAINSLVSTTAHTTAVVSALRYSIWKWRLAVLHLFKPNIKYQYETRHQNYCMNTNITT